MKTRCIILLLTVSLAMCACDANRRTQRRIRRMTERCPELVTIQAHPIDTFITLPPVVDSAVMPLAPILGGQTVTVTTEQGTFTAAATDDSLTVTYEAEPEPIHYEDTVHYAQVVIEEEPPSKKPPNSVWFLLGVVVVLAAILSLLLVVIIKKVKAS